MVRSISNKIVTISKKLVKLFQKNPTPGTGTFDKYSRGIEPPQETAQWVRALRSPEIMTLLIVFAAFVLGLVFGINVASFPN